MKNFKIIKIQSKIQTVKIFAINYTNFFKIKTMTEMAAFYSVLPKVHSPKNGRSNKKYSSEKHCIYCFLNLIHNKNIEIVLLKL